MIRACLLGNSHASSIKLALQSRYRPPGVEFSHYQVGGRTEPNLRLAGTRFKAVRGAMVRTDVANAAESGLDVKAFDMLLISAVGLRPPSEEALDSGECPIGIACPFDFTSAVKGSAVIPISWQMMEELIVARFEAHGAFRLLNDLARTYEGLVFVQLVPPPGLAAVEAPNNGLLRRYGDHAGKIWAAYFRFQNDVLIRTARKVLPSAHILCIPSDTESRPGFLQPRLSREGDMAHANALYGEMVLRQFTEQALKDVQSSPTR